MSVIEIVAVASIIIKSVKWSGGGDGSGVCCNSNLNPMSVVFGDYSWSNLWEQQLGE